MITSTIFLPWPAVLTDGSSAVLHDPGMSRYTIVLTVYWVISNSGLSWSIYICLPKHGNL